MATQLPSPTLPVLRPRDADSHKGKFGSALIIGGSRGMAGAISMTGLAAARTGAGTVRLAVPDCCLETVASFSPCSMTLPLAHDPDGRIALAAAQQLTPWLTQATCVAIGPGMGQATGLQEMLLAVLAAIKTPTVIDADGLNNLAALESSRFAWRKRLAAPLVITPHPGEWARLSGVPASDRAGQIQAAVELAAEHALLVVLKGHRTVITDGFSLVENLTGTPAMATGGSGDVLTGVITALICQGLSPRDAAHLGVHLHGLAGEIAADELSSHVVLPTELIQFLPTACKHSRTRSG